MGTLRFFGAHLGPGRGRDSSILSSRDSCIGTCGTVCVWGFGVKKSAKTALDQKIRPQKGPVEVSDRLYTCSVVHTWTLEHCNTKNKEIGNF